MSAHSKTTQGYGGSSETRNYDSSGRLDSIDKTDRSSETTRHEPVSGGPVAMGTKVAGPERK